MAYKYDRIAETEDSIRRYLQQIAELEPKYQAARLEEVANGVYSKKAFLESRRMYRLIQDLIRRALRIQATYNKNPDYATEFDEQGNPKLTIYKTDLADYTINNDYVFAASREILKKRDSYAEKQREGRERNRMVPAYYTPEGNLIPKDAKELEIYEEKQEVNPRMLEIEDIIQRQQAMKKGDGIDYEAILNSMPPKKEEKEEEEKEKELELEEELKSKGE
jgi:hypothetical protein